MTRPLNPNRLSRLIDLFSRAMQSTPDTWTLEDRARQALAVLPEEAVRELDHAASVFAVLAHERYTSRPAPPAPLAALEAWISRIETIGAGGEFTIQVCAPCPACGGRVYATSRGSALTVNSRDKTATFQPCGCMVTVPDMPERWRPC